ncbi:MAG: hypothetical protein ABEN55_03900 [Bradymonadaceae bacterium]
MQLHTLEAGDQFVFKNTPYMVVESREDDIQTLFEDDEMIPAVDLEDGSIWWFNPDKEINPYVEVDSYADRLREALETLRDDLYREDIQWIETAADYLESLEAGQSPDCDDDLAAMLDDIAIYELSPGIYRPRKVLLGAAAYIRELESSQE